MTYEFYSVVSGNGMYQELEAAQNLVGIIPLRLMLSYLYIRNFKEFIYPEWAEKTYLDSGAYSQINNQGDYPFPMKDYVEFSNNHPFTHISTLDYPCDERFIADLSIPDRIEKTVENTTLLIDEIENLVPVIQGKTIDDYLSCIDLYNERGLIKDRVGIGSICIRKGYTNIVPLIMAIKRRLPNNTKIHCYGLEVPSIKRLHHHIASSDSHSWGQSLDIGGRMLWFNKGKLVSMPRNKLPMVVAKTVSFLGYNLYLNHITNPEAGMMKFQSLATTARREK